MLHTPSSKEDISQIRTSPNPEVCGGTKRENFVLLFYLPVVFPFFFSVRCQIYFEIILSQGRDNRR